MRTNEQSNTDVDAKITKLILVARGKVKCGEVFLTVNLSKREKKNMTVLCMYVGVSHCF